MGGGGMNPIPVKRFVYLLVVLMAFSVFYQQVFVINAGASLKSYELLSIFLTIVFLFVDRPVVYGRISLCFFLFMVVVPYISYFLYLFDDDKYLYYRRFPDAIESLRTNVLIAPSLLLVYYLFNWVVVNYIISSELVFQNKDKIIKLFVISASIVSIYNFYAIIFIRYLGFPDLIPPFLDYRNAPTQSTGRFCGFSDEPGSYVVLQTWAVYYLLFYQPCSTLKRIKSLRVLNVASLLMSMSSMLLPALFFAFVYKVRKVKMKVKMKLLSVCLVVAFGLMQLISYLGLDSLVRYIVYEKVVNYLEAPDNTLDSGAFRSYTTRLGLELFKENPIIGTGGGTSCFYLWKNEFKMGITTFGETISSTTYPQNCYAKVLAELGIFGFLFLIAFFFVLIKDCRKYGEESSLCNISIYGILFVMTAMLSIYPETSLFLWFNMALAANEVYYLKKGKNVLQARY